MVSRRPSRHAHSGQSSAEAPVLARTEWVNACQFHDLSEEEVLREVARRVSGSKHPLVLLDLDSTLYEVGPRTRQILHEWLMDERSARFPLVRTALARMEHHHLGYSLRDTFKAVGLSLDAEEVRKAAEEAKRFWAERFFTSRYLQYDRVYPGAAQFVRELYSLGAELVYLTGRDAPGMGDGTLENLRKDGFPIETAKTHLLLKPSASMDDLRHKQDAAEYVKKHGSLKASFENEPLNLVALYRLFPESMHVFVDTVCSDHPAAPCEGLYRISCFKWDGPKAE